MNYPQVDGTKEQVIEYIMDEYLISRMDALTVFDIFEENRSFNMEPGEDRVYTWEETAIDVAYLTFFNEPEFAEIPESEIEYSLFTEYVYETFMVVLVGFFLKQRYTKAWKTNKPFILNCEKQ